MTALRTRRSPLRALAHLALAFALLAGWTAGLLHPLKHVDKQGELVHLAGLQSGGDKQPAPGAADPLCAVLAGLAACLVDSSGTAAERHAGVRVVAASLAGHLPAAAPPFLAQAPPTAL